MFFFKLFYLIKNVEELENLNAFVSLQNQVNEVRLQDQMGKQNFHENIKKVFEPLTDTIKNTCEKLKKSITGTSIENKLALENLNNNFQEIMIDRGILTSNLLSPLSKTTGVMNLFEIDHL